MELAEGEGDSGDLQCPVCLDTIDPPIFQCANGHLICGPCLDDVERHESVVQRRCPLCRLVFSGPRIRNLFAERRAAKRRRTGRDGEEEQELALLVGVWHYTTPQLGCVSSFTVEVDCSGRARISGMLSDGISSSGVLEKSGEWYQGDVRFGVVRLRRQGQHLLWSVRACGSAGWGPAARAHRCEVIGVWYYTIPDSDQVSSYVIDTDENGRAHMTETVFGGAAGSGVLEKCGEWYEGDIGQGVVRVRLDGQHALSNFRAKSSETWGPDVRAHRCSVLGTWRYALPDGGGDRRLLVDADGGGHVRASEAATSGAGAGTCLLEQRGDWHQGSLKHQEVRVCRDGQQLRVSFRPKGSEVWGPELVARRLAVENPDGVIYVCDDD